MWISLWMLCSSSSERRATSPPTVDGPSALKVTARTRCSSYICLSLSLYIYIYIYTYVYTHYLLYSITLYHLAVLVPAEEVHDPEERLHHLPGLLLLLLLLLLLIIMIMIIAILIFHLPRLHGLGAVADLLRVVVDPDVRGTKGVARKGVLTSVDMRV